MFDQRQLERLRQALDTWEETTLQQSLATVPERKRSLAHSSSESLQRLYTPLDIADLDYQQDLGFPGEFPHTRGAHPTMYRSRPWTMRQYAGYASAAETNRRFLYLLEQGQTGLSVAFDLPTQIGYDADDPMAEGEVGRVGVSISCLEDMQRLFQDIPLAEVSTSMTINAPAAILLSMYIAAAKKQGVDPSVLRGTIQNDILKEYIARGTYIFPPGPAMRLITDVFAYCGAQVPSWNTISISGYHMREAGCTAAQELAFTFANAIAYVEAALRSGLALEDFAPQLAFFFNAHNQLLEEVAKFRAARRLWAGIMRGRFGATDPRCLMLRFHTQTAGSTLTAQQPENNVVRVALQALAAVLGGTQSLHTNSMDEALGLPTERAAGLALRTQQILAHEAGVADTVDPLAGSFAIEALTNQLESTALDYLESIDSMGGALAAVESGYIQREIQEAAYQAHLALERKEALVVGVNAFQSDEAPQIELLRVDPAIGQAQRAHLAEVRSRRDPRRVEALLGALERAAKGSDNLMPQFIECVEADITLGEICGRLRQVWGEYRPAVTI
jgi:methylmalonyl-CoA mutase N-terminal domain/subunit